MITKLEIVMKTQNVQNKGRDKSQRGAALITVLLMSTLLLATGGALVLVTGLSNRHAIDATAEMQAYYSAEAGVQDTLNVFRGNVNPQAGMPGNSTIDFRKAVTPADSNRPNDNSGLRRLSGWLNYSYAGANGDSRVPLTANYSPLNGLRTQWRSATRITPPWLTENPIACCCVFEAMDPRELRSDWKSSFGGTFLSTRLRRC